MEFSIWSLMLSVALVMAPVQCMPENSTTSTSTSTTVPKTSSKGLSPALASALADLMASGGGEAQALGQLVGLGGANWGGGNLVGVAAPAAFGPRRTYNSGRTKVSDY
jgi:hypothetical protein